MKHRTLGLGLLLCALLWSSAAQARPRYGFEVKLGLTAPFTRYVRTASVLRDADGFNPDQGTPFIADATNNPGLSATALLTFRSFELSVSSYSFNWGPTFLRFEGDKEARSIDRTLIDDAGVNYSPLDPAVKVNEPLVGSDNLGLLTLDAGYRYHLTEGIIEAYLPFGAGLVAASVLNDGDSNLGLHAWTGFTTELVIGGVAFIFDARYNFILTGEANGTQQSINNAVVTEENVARSLISTLHFASFQVGFRYGVD